MNTFQYPQLQEGHIRLVDLHASSDDALTCSLRTADPYEPPPYDALSYAWGEGARTTVLNCDGSALRITHSLYTALQYLRPEGKSKTLWIDQICIDQKSDTEKTAQIPKIASIFNNAQRVLVWLGEEDKETDLVFQSIRAVAERAARHGITDQGQSEMRAGWIEETISYLQLTPNNAPEWMAYRSLLARAWFCRVWVYEEVVLAREVRVLCGRRDVSWDEFMAAYGALQMVSRILPGHQSYLLDDQGILPYVHLNRLLRRGHSQDMISAVSDLLNLVKALRVCGTLHPRDRIYGVLGVAKDLDDRTPAVSVSTDDRTTYCDFTKWFIHRYSDLSVLKLVDINARFDQERQEPNSFPSWTPNYHQYDFWNNLLVEQGPKILAHGPKRLYNATGAFKARLNDDSPLHLKLKGIRIGKIIEVSQPAGNLTGNVAIGVRVLTGGEWFDMATRHFGDGVYQHTNEPLAFAYARTRMGDYIPKENSASDRRARISEMEAQGHPTDPLEPGPVSFRDGLIYSSSGDISNSIIRYTTRRRLYVTDTGYMGTCHRSCRTGDEVYLLLGGDMPFILRKLEKGNFGFKGESYVHGIMDGEFLLNVKKPTSMPEECKRELDVLTDECDEAILQTEDIILV